MSTLQVHIDGIGVCGPGLPNWPQAAEVLTGRATLALAPVQLPPIAALPPAERRRAGMPIKLAFTTGFEAIAQAGADAATLRTVFTSSAADCDNCHATLEALASPGRAVSPTRFHNSVHNAPSGYWSIATACRAASTSLCAYDGSFAAGLLEAAAQALSADEACLLLSYDTPYPEPLASLRPISHPFGLALLLRPRRSAATQATLSLSLTRREPTRLADPALDQLRNSVPSARSLPLLQALAQGRAGQVTLDYLDAMTLDAQVHPPA